MADLVDSYEVVANTAVSCRASYYQYICQEFHGNGKSLTSAKFYVAKLGSPTGNIVAKLWAQTGTFGSGTGTGSPLATSDTINIANLTTSQVLTEFTFSTPYTLQNGTIYVIGVGYEGGDSSNCLQVGIDGTTKSDDGGATYLYYNGTWYARYSTADVPYYVYGQSAGAVLAGNIPASASLTGDFFGSQSIAGSASASASCTGNLLGSVSIAGAVTSQGAMTGEIIRLSAFAGAVSSSSVLAGNMYGSVSVSGAISSQAVMAGTFVGVLSFSGTAIGSSSVAGIMLYSQGLAGGVLASSLLRGGLFQPGAFVGDVVCASYVAGEIIVSVYEWLKVKVTLPDEHRKIKADEQRKVVIEEEQRTVKWKRTT
jgi:hypothetical protein